MSSFYKSGNGVWKRLKEPVKRCPAIKLQSRDMNSGLTLSTSFAMPCWAAQFLSYAVHCPRLVAPSVSWSIHSNNHSLKTWEIRELLPLNKTK